MSSTSSTGTGRGGGHTPEPTPEPGRRPAAVTIPAGAGRPDSVGEKTAGGEAVEIPAAGAAWARPSEPPAPKPSPAQNPPHRRWERPARRSRPAEEGRRPSALLVVGHGTRDAAGAEQFRAFVRRVRARAGALDGGLDVDGGFIELSSPPVADAVARLVAAGHRHLAVVPMTLVSAGHAKGDIPGSMAREQLRHPGLRYAYGRPLGPHPALLELLERRIDAVCPPPLRPETTVLLVGRGSTDPDANAEVFKVARLLWEGRGFAGVEAAFISLAEPGVPAGLERARRLGARRIVVAPYFLFTGVLPRRTAAQAAAWAAGHTDTQVSCAAVLSGHLAGDVEADGAGRDEAADILADLVLERCREALAGDIRMNCDTCLYRVALPGHAHRVGAPQTPHDHPDDPAHPHSHGHGHGHARSHAPHSHGPGGSTTSGDGPRPGHPAGPVRQRSAFGPRR